MQIHSCLFRRAVPAVSAAAARLPPHIRRRIAVAKLGNNSKEKERNPRILYPIKNFLHIFPTFCYLYYAFMRRIPFLPCFCAVIQKLQDSTDGRWHYLQ